MASSLLDILKDVRNKNIVGISKPGSTLQLFSCNPFISVVDLVNQVAHFAGPVCYLLSYKAVQLGKYDRTSRVLYIRNTRSAY